MSTFLCKNGVRKEYFLTPTFIIEPFVTDAVAQEISAAGGILIFGIGLTMSKIIAMRVGNMIPGLFIVAVMTYFFG